MAKRGKSARQKGHTFERDIAELFRSWGWKDCVTARSESRNTDDKGIDLCFTSPFAIQCKAHEKLQPGLHEILNTMPKEGDYNLVFHKRNKKGTLVAMTLEDFKMLVIDKMKGITNEQ